MALPFASGSARGGGGIVARDSASAVVLQS